MKQINPSDLVLTIAVFSPVNDTSRLAEFHVLASQKLTALRDAFYCLSDFIEFDESVINPNTSDKKISSSYFYIENVFYNDMRWRDAIDYSSTVIAWSKDQQKSASTRDIDHNHTTYHTFVKNTGPYSSQVMDEVKFIDLELKLNFPYLFMHQGNCGHTFQVKNIELIHSSHEQDANNYPVPLFIGRPLRQKHTCAMCLLRLPTYDYLLI